MLDRAARPHGLRIWILYVQPDAPFLLSVRVVWEPSVMGEVSSFHWEGL